MKLLLLALLSALLCSATADICSGCETLASVEGCEEQCKDRWATYDCHFICQQLLKRSNLTPLVACQRLGLCDKKETVPLSPIASVLQPEIRFSDDSELREHLHRLVVETAASAPTPRPAREEQTWLAAERTALEAAQRRVDDERAELRQTRAALEARAAELDASSQAIDKQRMELTSVLKEILALRESVQHTSDDATRSPEPATPLHAPLPPPAQPEKRKLLTTRPPLKEHTHAPNDPHDHRTSHAHATPDAQHRHGRHQTVQEHPLSHTPQSHGHEHKHPEPVLPIGAQLTRDSAYIESVVFWACAALGLLLTFAADGIIAPKLESLLYTCTEEAAMKRVYLYNNLLNIAMPSLLMLAAYAAFARPLAAFDEAFFLFVYLGLALGKTVVDQAWRVKDFYQLPLSRSRPGNIVFFSIGVTSILMLLRASSLLVGRDKPWLVAEFLLVRHIGDWVNGMYNVLGLAEIRFVTLDRFTAARSLVQAMFTAVWWLELSPLPMPWLLTSYMLLSIGNAVLDLWELVESFVRNQTAPAAS